MAKLDIGSQIHNIPETGVQYTSNLSTSFVDRSLVDKGYVDTGLNLKTDLSIFNTHASRHLPNGADALTTGSGITISNSTINSIGIANTLARADHSHKVELTTNQVNLTNSVTTTSTTYVIVPDASIIDLPAGDYIIFAYLQSTHSTNNATWNIAIAENLVLNASSINTLRRGGNQFTNVRATYIYSNRVTLGDALNRIDIVWRTVTTGTITTLNRGLVIMRVS